MLHAEMTPFRMALGVASAFRAILSQHVAKLKVKSFNSHAMDAQPFRCCNCQNSDILERRSRQEEIIGAERSSAREAGEAPSGVVLSSVTRLLIPCREAVEEMSNGRR